MSLSGTLDEKTTTRRRGRPPKASDAAESRRIAFPASLIDALERIRITTAADTINDVFRDAIRIYAYLADAHQKGKEVVIRDPTGSEQSLALFMPMEMHDASIDRNRD